jgi:hypothetical protein
MIFAKIGMLASIFTKNFKYFFSKKLGILGILLRFNGWGTLRKIKISIHAIEMF